MRDRFQEAIELRSTGHAEEARTILLDLVATYPDDAEVIMVAPSQTTPANTSLVA